MSATQSQSAAHATTRPRLLRWVETLTTPFLPDDYLELVNPLWSRRALNARVVSVVAETADAATITLKPGAGWQGHQAGQFVRIAVSVDGIRHWRCYSISSAPGRDDGCFSITVKAVDGGRVSTHLVRNTTAGEVLEIAAADGAFTWQHADPTVAKVLMVTGGSGITPVMSLLRHADAHGQMPDVTLLHYAPTADDVIFRDELMALASRHPQLKLHFIHTRADSALRGHFSIKHLHSACPDWKTRRVWSCGPAALLEAMEAQWAAQGLSAQLCVERFRPAQVAANAGATGGRIQFSASGTAADNAGSTSILETAEAAGLAPASGCRMGICHGCTVTLKCGQVRDLRDGRVFGEEGDLIQICVCAPAGDLQIDL